MVKFTSEQKSIERMDNMVLEEKKVKNICNFYVSEYHLEIMLLPYISKKIDNEENITIITEIDLESTLNVVIERINLDKDKKEKIKKIKKSAKTDLSDSDKSLYKDTYFIFVIPLCILLIYEYINYKRRIFL